MRHILIDTDVLMDFFIDRFPFSKHAISLLILAEQKKVYAYVTPVIISNLYYC
jgi:predicted nucleic acid-binding protein